MNDDLITIPASEDRTTVYQLIEGWDLVRLKRARVLVAGAGALGNEALKNLALLEIGKLFIVDFDTIEPANLARSVLFRESDVGQPKANVAAASVRALNPNVTAVAWQGDLVGQLGLGIFRRVDAVLGCLDNREARLALNRACWRTGKPYIDGGISVMNGMLKVFVPPDSACYECTMSEQDYALLSLRYPCPLNPQQVIVGKAPTTPTLASIIGAMQAQEVIKFLHGHPILTGEGAVYNGQFHQLFTVAYTRRADCSSHEFFDPIIELPFGAHEMTFEKLFDHAREQLGKDATVELGREIVIAFDCAECGRREQILRPWRETVPHRIKCPHCGAARTPHATHALRAPGIFAGYTLAEIGIPPLDILVAKNRGTYRYFELTGDCVTMLPQDW